jgi:Lrp/AsnC family leucine-responsive transcriptional regulator
MGQTWVALSVIFVMRHSISQCRRNRHPLTVTNKTIRVNRAAKSKVNLQMTFHIDAVGRALLRRLQEQARVSFRELGEAIGLTAPAVAERIRRLEEAGVITGYHAELDLAKAGLPIRAFVHLTSNARQSGRFREMVGAIPEIIECHAITGVESYLLKVAVPDVAHLENLLWKLKDYGEVRTSLVLSTQLARRSVDPRTFEQE